LLHLVGIISLLSMMHGTTNIKFTNSLPDWKQNVNSKYKQSHSTCCT